MVEQIFGDDGLCYNKINGCTKPRGQSGEYHAFCSKACWEQYNGIEHGIVVKQNKRTLEEWINYFKTKKGKVVSSNVSRGVK